MAVMLFMGFLEPTSREQEDGTLPLAARGPIVINGEDVGSILPTPYTAGLGPHYSKEWATTELYLSRYISLVHMKQNGPYFYIQGAPWEIMRALF